jgi:NADPH:quinone reductase-like Zn-dependent oxidoreductase
MTVPRGEIHRGVDVLRVAEGERPVPIDDDVLVRVHALPDTVGVAP